MDQILGTLLSLIIFFAELFGISTIIGTMGAWFETDLLNQTIVSEMAAQGGYTTDVANLVSTFQSGTPISLTISSPDGPGVAPVNYGGIVEANITRYVTWGSVVTLTIQTKGIALSTYLPTTSPTFTYTNP